MQQLYAAAFNNDHPVVLTVPDVHVGMLWKDSRNDSRAVIIKCEHEGKK